MVDFSTCLIDFDVPQVGSMGFDRVNFSQQSFGSFGSRELGIQLIFPSKTEKLTRSTSLAACGHTATNIMDGCWSKTADDICLNTPFNQQHTVDGCEILHHLKTVVYTCLYHYS